MAKKKTYRVAIAFEEGYMVYVEAKSEEDAKRKVLKDVENCGSVFESLEAGLCNLNGFETTHRDFFVADCVEDV